MNKKIIFPLACLLLLAGCGSKGGNTPVKSDSVEKVLSSISNNFTTNYNYGGNKYNFYRTENYVFDSELGGGQLVAYDDTMYVYLLNNDKVICRTPSFYTKEDFNNHYTKLNVDMSKFEVEDGDYITTDEETINQLGVLVNGVGYSKAVLYMDEGLLNFRFYNSIDKIAVTGKVYSINETKVEAVESYIASKIDPEGETYENKELIQAIGGLNDNFVFSGVNYTTKKNIGLLFNENYVMNITGSTSNVANGYGYLALEDGTHYFELANSVATVDFEIQNDSNFIKNNYPFKRHDFTKFIKLDANRYITQDYYNVKNMCDLLLLESTSINGLIIDLSNGGVKAQLLYNTSVVYEGVFTNINSAHIADLDAYVNKEKTLTLPYYANEELVAAFANVKTNFTFVNTSIESESDEFYGIVSDENGRKEYKEFFNGYPSTDYIVYDEAVQYNKVDSYLALDINKTLSLEEYNSLYSFESIDFHYFQPLGNNKYKTSSAKYLNTLFHITGGNPYASRQYSAEITLNEGKIEFALYYNAESIELTGYLKDINTTTIDFVDTYKANNTKPTKESFDNSALYNVIKNIQEKNNFVVEYQDDEEYNIHFTEADYDYWTEDTVYYGYYKSGFTTGSVSGYVYEFGYKTDEETGASNFVVSSSPSNKISSIKEFNRLNSLTQDDINQFIQKDGKFYSFDKDIYQPFLDIIEAEEGLYSNFCGVELSVENGELMISVIDEIDRSYTDGVYSEKYGIFMSAKITHIGSATIPSNARIPSIK